MEGELERRQQQGEGEGASVYYSDDTIAAIVTGGQSGAVSIVRVSGPKAVAITVQVFHPGLTAAAGEKEGRRWTPQSHRVYVGRAVDGAGAVLDEVLLLPMLAPRSYTAEDVVEIHTHGGGLCAQRVLQACVDAGARLAQRGEFTLRAFMNGRIDLSQAESVLQLIEARTVAAADCALAGLEGGIGAEIGAARQECLDLLGEVEARLDFDEDLPSLDESRLSQRISSLQQRIREARATARHGFLLRNGLQVALVGRPNVGKSSLLNAWSRTDRAIVTSVPGTTRDVLEAKIAVRGVPVTLLDTAGIRQSDDQVERIGVERSESAALRADIVIMVYDSSAGWQPDDERIFRQLWGEGRASPSCRVTSPCLLLANKLDLLACTSRPHSQHQQLPPVPDHVLTSFDRTVAASAATREGFDALEALLFELTDDPKLHAGGREWAVNERQGEALARASEALTRTLNSISEQLPLDFWTIDLRGALSALGEVTGDEATEEVLDNIFSRFCIGK